MNHLFKTFGLFSFNAADWPDWYADWKHYIQLNEISTKSDAAKISALLYNMGTFKAEVMQTFQYDKKRISHPGNEPYTNEVDEKDTCYEDVIKMFDNHCGQSQCRE